MSSTQQINLYTADLRRDPPPLHPQMMLEICGIFLVLLVLLGAYNIWHSKSLEDQLAVAKAELASTEQQLSVLQTPQHVNADVLLDQQIAQLQQSISNRKVISDVIQSQDLGNASGFSGHMIGLARQYESDISLTQFSLLNGGSEVRMAGATGRADRVPRYLAKLRNEVALVNARFGVLRIERDAPNVAQWHFTLGPEEVESAASGAQP